MTDGAKPQVSAMLRTFVGTPNRNGIEREESER